MANLFVNLIFFLFLHRDVGKCVRNFLVIQIQHIKRTPNFEWYWINFCIGCIDTFTLAIFVEYVEKRTFFMRCVNWNSLSAIIISNPLNVSHSSNEWLFFLLGRWYLTWLLYYLTFFILCILFVSLFRSFELEFDYFFHA